MEKGTKPFILMFNSTWYVSPIMGPKFSNFYMKGSGNDDSCVYIVIVYLKRDTYALHWNKWTIFSAHYTE